MSASRVITVSPPGRCSLASTPSSEACSGSTPPRASSTRRTLITLGSSVTSRCGGRMIESNHAADDRRRRAAATVAQDFVAVAHLFARQIEELRAVDARFARQPMAGAVWHQRESRRAAGRDRRSPSPPGRNDLTSRHGTSGSPRAQAESSAQGAVNSERAVDDAAHPQKMQRFAQRVGASGIFMTRVCAACV